MCDVLVIDFGSHYIDNITKCLKERNVTYKKVVYDEFNENVNDYKGIIMSGSPYSYRQIDMKIIESGVPVLGICYSMQLFAYLYGKKVSLAEKDENGLFQIKLEKSRLFNGIDSDNYVEMRHYYRVYEMPDGFRLTASTEACPIAAMENVEKKLYGVQFHPELGGCGDKILDNFLFDICKIEI